MPNIVKNTTFPGLFSLLAPHSCRGCGRLGEPLCDCCKNYIIKHHQNICPICHTQTTGLCPNCPDTPPTFVVGNRSDLLGKLIHDLKYNSVRSLAHPLAAILDQTIPADFAAKNPVVIVPLPTISQHIRERGFDHTHLIAKHFARLRNQNTPNKNYHVEKLLLRHQNTVQVGTDAATRKTQATSAYTLNPKIKIDQDTTYVLFDDVWTTGASMQTAYKLLKNTPAKNIILAILALSTFDQ